MSLTQGSGPLGRSDAAAANYTIQSPAHRILFQPDLRRLRAYIGDTLVLDTTRAHLLHETGIRPVAYVPLEDFDQELLERTDHTTHCPFNGDASYWSLQVGERRYPDIVWSYVDPKPERADIAGLLCFYNDKVDLYLDDELQ